MRFVIEILLVEATFLTPKVLRAGGKGNTVHRADLRLKWSAVNTGISVLV